MVIGNRIGPYEVLAKLGEGGMGEVYKARDTKLNRDVALKVLPDTFANDPDRLARFTREAKMLASLNHPNIAHIHGLEESGEVRALVMELVEGEDLSQRIARLRASGASARQAGMPLDEALPIAKQIAEALEAAHEQGIIHRDLKPANIKVRADGTVKVLDFGLAKAMEGPARAGPHDESMSPTRLRQGYGEAGTSPAMTQAGIILGTAAYMAPEQARGAPVDKRTDVWAFGCVLFEMLAGRHVFGGAGTVSDAIAAVLKSEPEWHVLPANTPSHIRSLLKRCLQKDARHRLRDIGDAGLLLGDASTIGDAAGPLPPAALSTDRSTWIRRAAVAGWVVAAMLAIVNTAWIAGRVRSVPPTPAAPLRLALPLVSAAPRSGSSRAAPSRSSRTSRCEGTATWPITPCHRRERSCSATDRFTSSCRSIATAEPCDRSRRTCAGLRCLACRPTVRVSRWRFRIHRIRYGCSTSTAMFLCRSRPRQRAVTTSRGRRTEAQSCIRRT